MYVAQAIPQIDAEIAEKGHFWMETSLFGRASRWKQTTRSYWPLDGGYAALESTISARGIPDVWGVKG
jgi:hypothetical protein